MSLLLQRRTLLAAGGCWLAGAAWGQETRALEGERIVGQVAPPAVTTDGRVLFVTEDALWTVWPAEARSERRPRPAGLVVDAATGPGGQRQTARLASAHTAAGLWLVGGAAAQLLRPDGQVLRLALEPARHALTLLALPDGSVLVLGGQGWPRAQDPVAEGLRVERFHLGADGRALAVERLPSLPLTLPAGRGEASMPPAGTALRLHDGAVLLTGDAYRRQCWLLAPGAPAWQVLPGLLSAARTQPALLQLPDGRVWASGAGRRVSDAEAACSSELWDPATRRWSPGPGLPVPMQGHQALWSQETDGRRRALLAGGRHAAVLAWVPGAPQLTLAALPSTQRLGAALVPLPGDRLARLSGLTARDMDEAHGRRSPGLDTVALAPGAVREGTPLWPEIEGAGVARRGDRVLAVGGTLLSSSEGSEDRIPTALVELHDLATGRVTGLPPLPLPAARAELAWLDDGQALALAWPGRDERWPWLGLLHLERGWRALDTAALRRLLEAQEPDTAQVRLAGFDGRRAWLVVGSAPATLDPASGALEAQARTPRGRVPALARLRPGGRLLLAGGVAQADIVATRPADCDDCADRFAGWGPRGRVRGHETVALDGADWWPSAAPEAPAEHVALLDDGRVVQFGRRTGPDGTERSLLELCDAEGRSWRRLPWPEGIGDDGLVTEQTHLLAAGAWLFLRLPVGDTRRWWWRAADAAPAQPWRVLEAGPRPLGLPPGGVPLGVADAQGRALRAQGGVSGIVVHPH